MLSGKKNLKGNIIPGAFSNPLALAFKIGKGEIVEMNVAGKN